MYSVSLRLANKKGKILFLHSSSPSRAHTEGVTLANKFGPLVKFLCTCPTYEPRFNSYSKAPMWSIYNESGEGCTWRFQRLQVGENSLMQMSSNSLCTRERLCSRDSFCIQGQPSQDSDRQRYGATNSYLAFWYVWSFSHPCGISSISD